MNASPSPVPALDPPLSTQVREILRERIIRGEFVQGARLPEARLAAELNVSRIPLRAAIPQLEVDGFVRTVPRRSAIVFEWDERAVHDLFDVRLAIEVMAAGYAARQAARGTSTAGIQDAIAAQHEAIADADPYEIACASTLVHERVVEVAGNQLLDSLMRAVSGRITWLFYLTSQRDPNLACQQHHELADSITSGNEALSRAVAFAHIEGGRSPSIAAIG